MKSINEMVYSLQMNRKISFILLPLLFALTACPPTKYKTDLDKVKDNNMDLPDLREQYYEGLRFKLSDLFADDYNNEYVIQDNALTRVIYDMDLNFSIEVFSKEEAKLIQFTFDEEISPLDAVHDNYVYKRMETLTDGVSSIKKKDKNCKYPCVTQVLHGKSSLFNEVSSYFMATVEANDRFYVIHLIGVERNMGYMHDDFNAILASLTQ